MNQYFFKMSKAEKNDILDKHKSVYDGYVTEFGKPNNQQPLYVQDFANDKNGITVSNTGNVKHYTNMNINESHTGLDKIADGPHDLENGTVDFRGIPDMSDVNREYFHDEYPSPNEDEEEYISVGFFDDDDDSKSMRARFFDKEDREDEWDDEDESRYDDRVNYDIDDESRYTDNDDWDDDEDEEEWEDEDEDEDEWEDENEDWYGEVWTNEDSEVFKGRNISDFKGTIDEDDLPDFIEKLDESISLFRRIIK